MSGSKWRRLLAYIVDLGIFWMLLKGIEYLNNQYNPIKDYTPENVDQAIILFISFLIALGMSLNWLYSACFESSSWQATLGKRIFGLIVQDKAGNRISFARATVRFWVKLFNLGAVLILFRKDRAALHDLVAETTVVAGRTPLLFRLTSGSTRVSTGIVLPVLAATALLFIIISSLGIWTMESFSDFEKRQKKDQVKAREQMGEGYDLLPKSHS